MHSNESIFKYKVITNSLQQESDGLQLESTFVRVGGRSNFKIVFTPLRANYEPFIMVFSSRKGFYFMHLTIKTDLTINKTSFEHISGCDGSYNIIFTLAEDNTYCTLQPDDWDALYLVGKLRQIAISYTWDIT